MGKVLDAGMRRAMKECVVVERRGDQQRKNGRDDERSDRLMAGKEEVHRIFVARVSSEWIRLGEVRKVLKVDEGGGWSWVVWWVWKGWGSAGSGYWVGGWGVGGYVKWGAGEGEPFCGLGVVLGGRQ